MKFMRRMKARRMNDQQVLVAARHVMEDRGYHWYGTLSEGSYPVCPATAIAAVVGEPSYREGIKHPAALRLARRFAPDAVLDLSSAVQWAQVRRNRRASFTTQEVLAYFDAEIQAGLDGPSRTIIVEPIETPTITPRENPEPAPAEAPESPERTPEREPEKVPAGT